MGGHIQTSFLLYIYLGTLRKCYVQCFVLTVASIHWLGCIGSFGFFIVCNVNRFFIPISFYQLDVP